MRKLLLLTMALLLSGGLAIAGCQPAPTPTPVPELKAPTVTLNRVEVAAYFPPPWAGWPGPPPTPTPPPPTVRVPLVLAFIFDINNPNPYPVTLDTMRFTVEFEATANEYFPVNTPIVHEIMTIPAGTTNQLRVMSIMDSAVVPGMLAVTSGARVAGLGLSAGALVKQWWEGIQDFSYGIRVTGGSAEFSSAQGNILSAFQGQFPR